MKSKSYDNRGRYSERDSGPFFFCAHFRKSGSGKGKTLREERLLAYLKGACSGRQYVVRGAELEQVLGVSGTDLRKLVNRLRRKGVPIGSSRDGYFYARTAGEVYSTIRQLQGMASGLEAAIRGLETALDGFSDDRG